MRQRTALAAAATATLLWLSRPCAAVDPEEVYQAGVADMKAGHYTDACPRFAEARRLRPDSTPALQALALCYDKVGKSASAWARYRELSVELKARGDTARAQAAADRAEELGKILSTLLVKLDSPDTPGLILRLDREEVPRVMFNTKMNVDPGSHMLEATAPGYEVWQTTLNVGEKNDVKEVRIPALHEVKATPAPPNATPGALVAPPPPPPPPAPRWGGQRIGGLVMVGVGLGGVITGAVFGARALSKMSTSNQTCKPANPADVCDQTGYNARQDAGTAATISTATFVAGSVLLAGGVVIFLTAPSGAAKPPASAGLLGIQIGATGAAGAVLRAEGAW